MAPFKLARDLKPGDTITRDATGETDDYTRMVVRSVTEVADLLRVSGDHDPLGYAMIRYYHPGDRLTVDSADPFEGLS